MLDLSKRQLCHRSIVLCHTPTDGLQFGVIDDIDETNSTVDVIIAKFDETETTIRLTEPQNRLFCVAHRQLPEAIKSKLIALSLQRINGPGDLRLFNC